MKENEYKKIEFVFILNSLLAKGLDLLFCFFVLFCFIYNGAIINYVFFKKEKNSKFFYVLQISLVNGFNAVHKTASSRITDEYEKKAFEVASSSIKSTYLDGIHM